MNSTQLIFLRFYNFTFGRLPLLSLALKRVLVMLLIKHSGRKYVASSRYFDMKVFLKRADQ